MDAAQEAAVWISWLLKLGGHTVSGAPAYWRWQAMGDAPRRVVSGPRDPGTGDASRGSSRACRPRVCGKYQLQLNANADARARLCTFLPLCRKVHAAMHSPSCPSLPRTPKEQPADDDRPQQPEQDAQDPSVVHREPRHVAQPRRKAVHNGIVAVGLVVAPLLLRRSGHQLPERCQVGLDCCELRLHLRNGCRRACLAA